MLVLAGVALVVVGVALLALQRLGIGRLPGDVVVRGERSEIHFPIATSILLSIVLTLLLWLVQRFRG